MNIIQPGRIEGEKVRVATCPHCRCVFEFAQKETKMNYDQRDGDFLSVKCPTCAHDVTISVK